MYIGHLLNIEVLKHISTVIYPSTGHLPYTVGIILFWKLVSTLEDWYRTGSSLVYKVRGFDVDNLEELEEATEV